MMAGSIYGMQNYYNAFVSPLKSYETNPITSLMYGATSGRIYSQTVGKKLQSSMSSYLSSMNSRINSLKTDAKTLASKDSASSFNQKAVTSDNAAVKGTAAPNATAGEYTLNISKLATAQTNTGKALVSNESSFDLGQNSISIKVGNNTQRNVYFNIDEKDTNLTSLKKMASSINSAKLGVTAGVISDSKTGTSYLSIVSDKTGTDNAFNIADVTGDAAETTGISNVTTAAQNAEYSINGKQYTSQQNTASADNGKVSFSFNKAEGKDIKVRVGTDTEAIKNDIKDFVRSYNSVISFVNTNSSDYSGAAQLKNELGRMVSSRGYSLQSIGVNTKDDGTLEIDEKKLDNALSKNLSSVKDTFSGYNGIAQRVLEKSNEVLSSPMKYSKPNEFFKDASSYYNFMSSRNITMNSRNMYSGLIVDTLL